MTEPTSEGEAKRDYTVYFRWRDHDLLRYGHKVVRGVTKAEARAVAQDGEAEILYLHPLEEGEENV